MKIAPRIIRGRPPGTIGLLLTFTVGLLLAGCDDAPEGPGRPTVQRLQNSAYVNNVRALFEPMEIDISVASLPPEPEVNGFDNHVALSAAHPALVESYRLVAEAVATQLSPELPRVSGCTDMRAECVRAWLDDLEDAVSWSGTTPGRVTAAFDRWSLEYGVEAAARSAIKLLLLSPEFTYAPRSAAGARAGRRLPARALARRMALFIWNAAPDAELLRAADAGELDEADGAREQAERLLADQRARDGVLNFYRQLLDWEDVRTANLDLGTYLPESPHIDGDSIVPRTSEITGEYLRFRLQPAIVAEAESFVTHHVWSADGTLGALLTATDSFATWDLAQLIYGAEVDTQAEPVRILPGPAEGLTYSMYPVALDPAERAGLLTGAAFLHAKSGPIQPSPVHRGQFVLERLLCRPPPPPPGDIPSLVEPDTEEPRTNRERYAVHTASPACQGCHESMDSIGFTFEGYDSLGQIRSEDGGFPVDSSGALFGTDRDGELADAVDLAHVLASSRSVHDCHTTQWFRYGFGRSEGPEDDEFLVELRQSFWESGGDIRALLADIVASNEFRSWRISE